MLLKIKGINLPWLKNHISEKVKLFYIQIITNKEKRRQSRRAARDCISQNFAGIKKMNDLDIIVVNVENAISGAGITRENAKILHAADIDIMTPPWIRGWYR